MGDPPRVRASCIVQPETWTRLPDAGFEILHSFPGNQAIDAHPLRVQIRRLGPQVPADAPADSVSTLSADGLVTAPFPYDASEQRRAAQDAAITAAEGERDCIHCEAIRRLYELFDLLRKAGEDEAADAVNAMAKRVGRQDALGREIPVTLLGLKR